MYDASHEGNNGNISILKIPWGPRVIDFKSSILEEYKFTIPRFLKSPRNEILREIAIPNYTANIYISNHIQNDVKVYIRSFVMNFNSYGVWWILVEELSQTSRVSQTSIAERS